MEYNEFVEDGRSKHKRLDAPELAGKQRKERDTIHTRSVTISSEEYSITGRLDLLEEKNGDIYPVEYKRSKLKLNSDGEPIIWDNDAVQLCAQALMLEEKYEKKIECGYLYFYGSNQRVSISINRELRGKTKEYIEQAKALVMSGKIPPPLDPELSNRCPPCSLVAICQPEEIRVLQTGNYDEEKKIDRVIPQSYDSGILYVQDQGASIIKKGEYLEIFKKDGEKERIPLQTVREVVLFGNVNITTQAQNTLINMGINLTFLSSHGKFQAVLMPAPQKNITLRFQQFNYFQNPEIRLKLAKEVINAKVQNSRTFLMRGFRSMPEPGENLAVKVLADALKSLEDAGSLETILGIEGNAARTYFSNYGILFKNQVPGGEFHWNGRNRRPPRDPVNAMLSLGYTMLCRDFFSALMTVGLDPYMGFYHGIKNGRPSLALDLMEEFRSIVVDSVVLTMINNRMIDINDFIIWKDSCVLNSRGRKNFFSAYENRKNTMITHHIFGYQMSYSRMFEVQSRFLAAYLRGDLPEYKGFVVR